MATLHMHKVVAALPGTLTPNTVYAVRTGAGFDLYISDATGAVAHQVNSSAGGAGVAIGTAQLHIYPVQHGQASHEVSAPDAVPGARVLCQLAANAERDADELDGLSVVGEAGAGVITVTVTAPGAIVGHYTVNFLLG